MCLAWPMQVLAVRPGHATVCRRDDPTQRRDVRTALVGPVAPGDWLLVFLDDARERLDVDRALEIDATLSLLEAAVEGRVHEPHGAAFVLPSSLPPPVGMP